MENLANEFLAHTKKSTFNTTVVFISEYATIAYKKIAINHLELIAIEIPSWYQGQGIFKNLLVALHYVYSDIRLINVVNRKLYNFLDKIGYPYNWQNYQVSYKIDTLKLISYLDV